jgi:hypothetical protein
MATIYAKYKVWNANTSTWDLVKLEASNSEKLNNKTSDYYLNYNNLSNKPTIPTISTNISTDGSSDTKTASPKAVKTYTDNAVANLGKIKIDSTWYTATLSGTTLTFSS